MIGATSIEYLEPWVLPLLGFVMVGDVVVSLTDMALAWLVRKGRCHALLPSAASLLKIKTRFCFSNCNFFHHLLQDNVPAGINIVQLYADRSSQALVIKSPLYDSKASVNVS